MESSTSMRVTSRKLFALLEVIGILVVGWSLTRVVISLTGAPPLQEHLDLFIQGESSDFSELTKIGFLTLFIQFCCLMIPAYLVTRFVGKRGLKSFGVGSSTLSLSENIRMGVVIFCLVGIPMKLLLLSFNFFDLGTVPDYWALFDKDWNLSFWLFMAVGSYVVIPVFEEIFYRGYALGRLELDAGFSAVILVSVLFALVHFQYFITDMFNIGMLLSLFLLALGMGFSRSVTGSIIAPITIHALMNIPLEYPYDSIALIAMFFVVALEHQTISEMLTQFTQLAKKTSPSDLALVIVVVAFAAGMNNYPSVAVIGFASLLIVSLIYQRTGRRSENITAP